MPSRRRAPDRLPPSRLLAAATVVLGAAAVVATPAPSAASPSDVPTALRAARAAAPAAVVESQTPLGLLRTHLCTLCVTAVAADASAVWMGTANAGVLRVDRATGAATRHTVADGLGGDAVIALVADARGHVWAATRDRNIIGRPTGISRFDGAAWRVFGPADGLPAANVQALAADASDGVWVGFSGQVFRWDGAVWTPIGPNLGVPQGPVTALAAGPDGAMWLGAGDEIGRWDGARFQTIGPDQGMPRGQVSALALGPGDAIWVGLGNVTPGMPAPGLARFEGGAWSLLTTQDGLAGNLVRDVVVDAAGRVWVAHAWETASAGSDHFLSVLENGAWRWQRNDAGTALPSNQLIDLALSPEGTAVAGSISGGASLHDGATWRLVRDPEPGPFALIPQAVERAPGGRVWVGYAGIGGTEHLVGRLEGAFWGAHGASAGLPVDALSILPRSLAFDPGGQPWFALQHRDLRRDVIRYDGVRWRTLSPLDGLPPYDVLDVAFDRAGRPWLALQGGVARRDGSTWTRFTSRDGLPGENVRALAVAPGGDVWAGTVTGAARFDGRRWQAFRTADGLPDDTVLDIAFAPDGAVWLATYRGLARFDGSAWTAHTNVAGIRNAFVEAVAVDHRGRVWAAVVSPGQGRELGVARLEGTTWTQLTTADGLAHDAVYDITVDDRGHVWLATLYGLGELVPPDGPPPPAAGECVCRSARRTLPAAVLADALANPADYAGWREPANPNRPPGPSNPPRVCLDVLNPGTPFHALFNGPIWRAHCR